MTQDTSIDHPDVHQQFLSSSRRHVLMITNHGIHQWKVIPGLPDTGGQNVFVNHFTEAMAKLGYKITIANRGGYAHPKTGELHRGLRYKNENERILYLEDGVKSFVRKEDMDAQIPALLEFLRCFLEKEHSRIDLILSHYWDAAKLGVEFNRGLPQKVKHIWTPHSVGSLKKQNMAPSTWANLRVDERIATEKEFIPELDGIAATSGVIRESLLNDYGVKTPLFLPPCVDAERYHKRSVDGSDPVWSALSKASGLSADVIRQRKIVTEVSRTDTTKRKDVLIKAFAQAHKSCPESFLIVTIDDTNKQLWSELNTLIDTSGIRDCSAVLGSVWELLPSLYSISSVYCTPSVMEGFGMSIQEAAACEVPAVSSDLVPFAVEYLLGSHISEHSGEGLQAPIRVGAGAIVVKADDVAGFGKAIEMLLSNEDLRRHMGREALKITVPYFTWEHMTKSFLTDIGELSCGGSKR
jgi:mannosylfructose-phosphate synthase